MTADQGCADPGYPISLSRVVPIADVAVSPAEDARRIEWTGHRFCAPHLRGPRRLPRSPDARAPCSERIPMGAFTADQFTFNHRNAEIARSCALGSILTHRSGAQHYDVISIVGCCHGGPFCRLR